MNNKTVIRAGAIIVCLAMVVTSVLFVIDFL